MTLSVVLFVLLALTAGVFLAWVSLRIDQDRAHSERLQRDATPPSPSPLERRQGPRGAARPALPPATPLPSSDAPPQPQQPASAPPPPPPSQLSDGRGWPGGG
ncbi:MAG: hypothetical protein VKK62_08085 [Synechococcaceae cyanobacterium]|nr:hypothetical protein [Synechococcaceae cyanobacterium]